MKKQFEVKATVFGIFSHGKLKGQVNPKSQIGLTVVHDSVRDATKHIERISGGAASRIDSVRELAA